MGQNSIYTLKNDKLVHSEKILAPFEQEQDTTEVIVNLIEPSQKRTKTQWNSPASRKTWRAEIHTRQQEVLSKLSGKKLLLRHLFENQAGFSAHVTQDGLEELVNNPMVESIEPVIMLQPHLAQGIPLMNASTVRQTYNGQGVAIAICDTGIDYTHPALGNGGFPNAKVIGGYDYGDNDADPMPEDGDNTAHGTCCAGIAAGDVLITGDYIGGVAYNARLYALKITAGSSGSTSSDDIVAAWNWCITHQYDDSANPILVISTSFGGGQYFTTCDNTYPAARTAADNAVNAGITVLVSSGNEGYCDAMGWPACISSVISVGAVYDASFGNYYPCVTPESCAQKTYSTGCATSYYASDSTFADRVTSYSNTASFLDVLAPSNQAYTTDIVGPTGYSSDNYDTSFGGTSAACPYTAGAVACLQSAAMQSLGDYLSPAEVRNLLTSMGDDVTDIKIATTKPRINLGNAINTLNPNPTPPVTHNATISMKLGGSVAIKLQATDEGLPNPPGVLDYIITSLPEHGTLTDPAASGITGVPYTLLNHQNEVTYTSSPTCGLPVEFTFIAHDSGTPPDGGDSNTATVSINIEMAPEAIYSANMDTNPGWTLDSYWAWGTPTGNGGNNHGNPDPTSGYTGSNVVGYNLAGDYTNYLSEEWATAPAIDCRNYTNVTLKFYRWLNVEQPWYDHAYIQVSNNGVNWSTIWENTSEITDSSWTLQTFDISSISDNQSTVYVRWGMGTTDYSWTYSGWNIDDVEVTGTGVYTPLVGDFEPDCDVDFDDLSLLISYWLQSCGNCEGTDLLADGIVNLKDYALLAQNWLMQE